MTLKTVRRDTRRPRPFDDIGKWFELPKEPERRRSEKLPTCDALLRIWSDSTTAAEVAHALTMRPDWVAVTGELIRPRYPGSRAKQHGWGGVRSDAELGRKQPLDRHLAHVAAFISQHRAALRTLARTCNVQVFAGLLCWGVPERNARAIISHETIKGLAAAPLELVLDYRPPGPIRLDMRDALQNYADWSRKYACVALRITSDTLTVAELNDALQTMPTR